MAFLGKAAFAKLAEVSRQRIYKMVQDGHLTQRPDGKLDTEDPTNKNYLNSRRDEPQNPTPPSKPQGAKKTESKQKPKKPSKPDPPMDPGMSDEALAGLLPEELQGMSKYDLDRLKTAIGFLKSKTENDIKRGEYIPRETVRKVFHALYRIDSEEFLQMSAHLAPRICQDALGTMDAQVITKVTELIDTELYKVQNHIRIALNKELREMGIQEAGA